MAVTSASTRSQPHLLGLPPELRACIYEYALTSPDEIEITTTSFQQPTLLRVNRQVRSEACLIWYLSNAFAIRTPNFNPAALEAFDQHVCHHWRQILRNTKIVFLNGAVPRGWSNLLHWLKKYHEQSIYPGIKPSAKADLARKAASKAFEIVAELEDLPWEQVQRVLEIHKKSVEEQSEGKWTWT